MSFTALTPDELRAAQILTTATMACWILIGLVPSLRAHAHHIRIGLLAAYLLGVAGFVVYVLALK